MVLSFDKSQNKRVLAKTRIRLYRFIIVRQNFIIIRRRCTRSAFAERLTASRERVAGCGCPRASLSNRAQALETTRVNSSDVLLRVQSFSTEVEFHETPLQKYIYHNTFSLSLSASCEVFSSSSFIYNTRVRDPPYTRPPPLLYVVFPKTTK